MFKPIPSVVPAVNGDAVTREKIELGKTLYWSTILHSGGKREPGGSVS